MFRLVPRTIMTAVSTSMGSERIARSLSSRRQRRCRPRLRPTSPGERRRVVDAVAHHRDVSPLLLRLRDAAGRLEGTHFGDANLGGDSLSSGLAVAREHHRARPAVEHRGAPSFALGSPDAFRL